MNWVKGVVEIKNKTTKFCDMIPMKETRLLAEMELGSKIGQSANFHDELELLIYNRLIVQD